MLSNFKIIKHSCTAALMLAVSCAQAQGAAIFKAANFAAGQNLITQNRCASCHAQSVGGDGSAIYQPMQRIKSAPELRGMVENCNLKLNMGLFPDEVTDIAAVLNRDYYKFKD